MKVTLKLAIMFLVLPQVVTELSSFFLVSPTILILS